MLKFAIGDALSENNEVEVWLEDEEPDHPITLWVEDEFMRLTTVEAEQLAKALMAYAEVADGRRIRSLMGGVLQ
jgi:hypothetical protein